MSHFTQPASAYHPGNRRLGAGFANASAAKAAAAIQGHTAYPSDDDAAAFNGHAAASQEVSPTAWHEGGFAPRAAAAAAPRRVPSGGPPPAAALSDDETPPPPRPRRAPVAEAEADAAAPTWDTVPMPHDYSMDEVCHAANYAAASLRADTHRLPPSVSLSPEALAWMHPEVGTKVLGICLLLFGRVREVNAVLLMSRLAAAAGYARPTSVGSKLSELVGEDFVLGLADFLSPKLVARPVAGAAPPAAVGVSEAAPKRAAPEPEEEPQAAAAAAAAAHEGGPRKKVRVQQAPALE